MDFREYKYWQPTKYCIFFQCVLPRTSLKSDRWEDDRRPAGTREIDQQISHVNASSSFML